MYVFVVLLDFFSQTILPRISVDSIVCVHFNLRGNEAKGRYFVNLNAWKVDSLSPRQQQHQPQYQQPQYQQQPPQASWGAAQKIPDTFQEHTSSDNGDPDDSKGPPDVL